MAVVNKTALLTVRLTEARKALYREQAATEGLRLSEWVRRLAERRVAEQVRQVGDGA